MRDRARPRMTVIIARDCLTMYNGQHRLMIVISQLTTCRQLRAM